MHKIEVEMVDAVVNGHSWCGGNTMVVESGGKYSVYLHGNCIAHRREGYSPDRINLCGWNTATTRSRLNALGVHVTSRNSTPYVGERKIGASGWFLAPRIRLY